VRLEDLETEAGKLAECANVKIIHSDLPIYSIKEQLCLPKLIPPSSDVFWSFHFNIPLLYRISHRGKLLVTIHDLIPLSSLSNVQNSGAQNSGIISQIKSIAKKLYAAIMFIGVRLLADKVICNSNFTEQEFRRFTKAPEGLTEIIYMGVDAEKFSGRFSTASKQKAPQKLNERYLLYIGNVKPHKNLQGLLAAYRIYASLANDSQRRALKIAGKKEGFITADDGVLNLAESINQDLGKNSVQFTGEISDEEMLNLLKNADCLVIPSFIEGFGLPALEAMAAGVPVLSSNAASLPEVCGDAAIYFDPHNPAEIARVLVEALSDSSDALKIRENLIMLGKKRVCEFNWGQNVSKTRELLEYLLG
jgi:glycosyltransferase involved in cell wall biosynthesis